MFLAAVLITQAQCLRIDSAGLPLIYLYNRYPRLIKPTLWLGLAMNTVSLLAASWIKSVNGLIVLQGIFPGKLDHTQAKVVCSSEFTGRTRRRSLRFPHYPVDPRVRSASRVRIRASAQLPLSLVSR